MGKLKLNEADAKKYFDSIFKLEQTGEPFPVNLEDVWSLIYKRQIEAVRELRRNFIEGVDFNLCQDAKVVKVKDLVNGIKIDAELSTSCMEYLIVRKNRLVFDVYRECRKTVQEFANNYANDPIIKLRLQQMEHEKRISKVEYRQDMIEEKITDKIDFYTVKGYASLKGIKVDLETSKRLGKIASSICRERGVKTGKVNSQNYGTINAYPTEILHEVLLSIKN